MSQRPTTPRTSPEATPQNITPTNRVSFTQSFTQSPTNNQGNIPFVFTFGGSSSSTTSPQGQSMFVFTAGTTAAERNRNDAAPLTPETAPVQLNASLDMLDGLVLSDVDSSAEQDVENDNEEKVPDESEVVQSRYRVTIPPREVSELRRNFQASMANIAASMSSPVRDRDDDDETQNDHSQVTEEDAEIVDQEVDAETETVLLSDTDEEDLYAPEIVDDTSLPIQTHLFPTTTMEPEIGMTSEDINPTCSVCYSDLTIKNSVTALCGHTYCNKCFFRWMETNATCACCRRPFDSKTNLTDEQLDREYDECYIRYQHLLIRHNTALQQSNRILRQNIVNEERTKSMMARQIRLRTMIDYSRGYNDGCVAAHDKIINGGKGIESKCWKGLFKNNEWANGFNKAYNYEMRQMRRKMNKLEKINDSNQTKRRRAFKNFNLSEDEETAFA